MNHYLIVRDQLTASGPCVQLVMDFEDTYYRTPDSAPDRHEKICEHDVETEQIID